MFANATGKQGLPAAEVAASNEKAKGENLPPRVAHKKPFAHSGQKNKALNKALTSK